MRDRTPFEKAFSSGDPSRDKFLARVFGIFSEEVVRTWCRCTESPYLDLGRPTVRRSGQARGSTLDFTFQDLATGLLYVGELKCWPEYQNHQFLRLESSDQLGVFRNSAFVLFLELSRAPSSLEVALKNGRTIDVGGTILVWGSVSESGRHSAIETFGFHDVLSLEDMIRDLGDWQPSQWEEHLAELQAWSVELYEYLGGGKPN